MPRTTPLSSERRPWMGLLIWGWRLEIGLVVAALLALTASEHLGPLGPYIVAGLALVVLRQRPDLRRKLSQAARRNREERWMHAALWHCAIVGRDGRVPRVVRSSRLPVGRRHLVLLPMGLHFEAVKDRMPELAAALSARGVRVKAIPQNARYLELVVVESSPFVDSFASPLLHCEASSLWDPIQFGVDEDGLAVSFGLFEHNLLIGGEPGSGKSVALSTIVAAAALDRSVSLTLLDGKHVELAAWSPVAHRFVGSDQEDAVSALEELRQIMDARYATLLATRKRKIARTDLEGLHVLVIDELAFYLRGGQKATRESFSELLRDLISRGRAAGVIVVAATQKPSHDVVPTYIRDLFSFRLAMRCTNSDASDTILGQGWAAEGFSASGIDPAARGVGYLLAEGGVPELIMTPYLSDEDIDVLAARALEHRHVS